MTTAAGLVGGAVADAVFGDPRTFHPVAGFGRAAAALERRMWRPTRVAGAAYAATCVTAAAVTGHLAVRRAGSARRTAVTLAATWAVVGGKSLGAEALRIDAALAAGDIEAARALIPRLCGRDPASLDEAGIVRATVESVAENTSDAVVAPLLWGAVAGPAGLLGYRAANTLDAMVGHRSARYAQFGWAAARLDDVANIVPARVTALIAAAGAPVVGGSVSEALRVMRADGRKHPSPNSGWCEAAFAGALGVRLGGTNVYAARVEHRPQLGSGRAPTREDITRAVRLQRVVTGGAAVLAAGIAAVVARVTLSTADSEKVSP